MKSNGDYLHELTAGGEFRFTGFGLPDPDEAEAIRQAGFHRARRDHT